MLAIKLSRIGKKNQPHYRLIITEKGRDPFGESLEILGDYNPRTKALQIKGERVKYWLSKGAKMTPTVNNLLVDKGVVAGEKIRASKDPKNTEVEKTEETPKEKSKEGLEEKPMEAVTEPVKEGEGEAPKE